MRVLTRDAILAEIEAGRLIIDPYSADQMGAASIDLTPGARPCRVALSRTDGEAIHRGRFANQSEL